MRLTTCFAPVRAALACWLLAVSAATAVLVGCGPGVGGTGTGDTLDALAPFGASAASVCASDLASVLACPVNTGVGGGAGSPLPGTAPVYLADTIDGRRVAVSLQGNLIEVNAPCAAVQFRGQWGLVAGQVARFYGTTGQDAAASTATTPATLQAVVRGNGLELTLTDTQGRVLLGPVLVTVRPTPAAPGACG